MAASRKDASPDPKGRGLLTGFSDCENIMSVNQSGISASVLSQPERYPDAVSPVPSEGDISLLDILIVIVQHRRLILKIAAYTVVIGVIVSLLLPIRYTATTSVLPPQAGKFRGARAYGTAWRS